MDFGVALPNFSEGAAPEGVDAAAETAERLGWASVWTTDHVLVDRASARDYGQMLEALATLAWVAGRHERIRIGTSVIVVPLRNAVLLARELATLDALSGGRLTCGVGVGWNEREFSNVGAADRFHRRGAYLDEAIRLWRHLWSGSTEPFRGRFHSFEDFAFEPQPPQGADLPIWVGGRAEPALRRAGALGDAYQSTRTSPQQYAVYVPVVQAAAAAAGRPTPALAARVNVRFGPAESREYSMAGTPEQMVEEVEGFAELGVSTLVLAFGTTDPEEMRARMERFERAVAAAVRERPPVTAPATVQTVQRH
jgi:probable F420-dependent oxidoreductase